MKVKQIATLCLLLIAALTLPPTLMAWKGQPGPEGGAFGPGPGDLAMLMELGLTDSQKAEVAAIFAKYKEEMKEKMDGLQGPMEELFEVSEGDVFCEEDIRQAFQQTSSLREELMVLRAKIHAEIRAVLGPEQIEMLKALKAKRKEAMQERFGSRPPRLDAWPEEISTE